MTGYFIDMFFEIMSSCLNFAQRVFDSVSGWGWILASIVLAFGVRLLFLPLVGNGYQSDSVVNEIKVRQAKKANAKESKASKKG